MLRNAIVTIYSQVVHQPSGIRRFWFGVSLLSPLRPILRNGNPLLKFLENAFTGERIPQRPTPRHLWATDRPKMCYPTCQQLPWCTAHGHTGHVASPTKKPIMIVAVDVKKTRCTTNTTRGSVYKALVLPTLLYGYEACSLREDLFKRLRSFHNRCARSMCRIESLKF